MGKPRPLFKNLFLVFSNKNHYNFLLQIYVKKCRSSIQYRDSNPRPLKHEPRPKTTRPGLPPLFMTSAAGSNPSRQHFNEKSLSVPCLEKRKLKTERCHSKKTRRGKKERHRERKMKTSQLLHERNIKTDRLRERKKERDISHWFASSFCCGLSTPTSTSTRRMRWATLKKENLFSLL